MPGIHTAFSWDISFVFSNLPLSLPVFHDLDIFAEYWSVMLQNDPQLPGSVWCFLMIRLRLYPLLQEYHRSDMPESASLRGYTMLICLVVGEVNLDHSVQVVNARFHLYKATGFSLCNTYLGRGTLSLCKYTIFPQTLAQYFDICWWILPATIITEMFI